MMKGIRRQIVLQYFILVLLALLLIESIFLVAMQKYYYDSIYNYIESNSKNVIRYYNSSFIDSSNESSFISNLMYYLKLENTSLEILDTEGRVLALSSGFESDRVVQTSDVPQALKGSTGRWIGKDVITGESVMAVSTKIDYGNDNVYIARYVTSMERVNDALVDILVWSGLIVVGVLVLVFTISIGLANSIVRPINIITAASAEMAKGRFDVRIEGDYKYEIGELSSTLNYMAEEIVRSNQVKDDFISSISHELRTPLTSIKGWNETLESGGYDPEETKMGLKIISKETNRLIGLVEELLDFSKLQQNEMKMVKGTVSVREVLQEIMLNVWAKAEQKQIKLRLSAEEEDYLIIGDGNRLKQVFLNVIDNAIKFSHMNTWIDITIKREQDQVVVIVQDTGIGISEEHLERVKDRFYQVDHQHGGTGLGLAISQQLIELHGGTLQMESELGNGTTVTVKLPALTQEEHFKSDIDPEVV
ncbi:sensor histidine kinase [Paenibacillus sp. J45TS6]|uniref:sensor histidine kinase n=1 Tax=Paenibacillus sp. J45TS6 TaxID=2807196 RepID=UPI001B014C47|nr:HAMP domain-containing sensor histidine kinase [Paenibacillus sp. J45TS6]GIP42604.1 sensor histidine kinase [Paenibacillus sp. J45TS6]